MLHSVHFIPFLLRTLITWAAILLHDYSLMFVAEVERCWVVRRLSWGLGFFYLNRYLVLSTHIPMMLGFFWSTSNPNKTEVSIPLLKSLVLIGGGKVLMHILPDVSIYPSLALEIAINLLTSCRHLGLFHEYLNIIIQAVISCRPILFQNPLGQC